MLQAVLQNLALKIGIPYIAPFKVVTSPLENVD